MAFFGRKKDEDEGYEDEDELIEEERENRKLTRKFKDLKRENRKKRKEPPKPWGRKERLTVLIILVVTMVVAGALTFSNRAGITFSKFPLPSFDFDFSKLNPLREETITIQKK